MSDSLSNFFSHLKNAQNNRILVIEHPKSKIIISILEILQESGYIRGYRLNNSTQLISEGHYSKKTWKNNNKIEILLKYKNQKPVINKILRISKPSKRIYYSVNKLNILSKKKNKIQINTNTNINSNMNDTLSSFEFMKGILILSTSKGIMSNFTANRLNIGGEVLCQIF